MLTCRRRDLGATRLVDVAGEVDPPCLREVDIDNCQVTLFRTLDSGSSTLSTYKLLIPDSVKLCLQSVLVVLLIMIMHLN